MDINYTECCYFGCENEGPLLTGGRTRIETIIQSSKERNDALHINLQDSVDEKSKPTHQIP